MSGLAWVAPWALAGLALVALPILIHLMGRAPARERRFPSLRFIAPSRLLPRRRARVEDPLLLALRLLVIVLAVMALAAPAWRGASPPDSGTARAVVVVVDTSRSVTGGRPGSAAEFARIVDSALAGVTTSRVVHTVAPAGALASAGQWLASQVAQRELLIVSDFQRGALDSASLAVVPATVRVVFRRVSGSVPGELLGTVGGAVSVATLQTGSGRAEASWARRAGAPIAALQALSSRDDESFASALINAAGSVGAAAPPETSQGDVAIVLPSFAGRDAAIAARAPRLAWQRTVIGRLAADAELYAAFPAGGEPFVARGDSVAGRGRLLLIPPLRSDTAQLLALAIAARRALGAQPLPAELVRATTDDATLARWAAAGAAAAATTAAASAPTAPPVTPAHGPAARWLWMAALLLLLIEWWARRLPVAPQSPVPDAIR